MNTITTKIYTFLFLLFSSLIITLTHTQSAVHAQTVGNLNLLGHFGGATNAAFIDSNTVYMGMGGALAIMDISDPNNPTLIGKSDPFPEMIRDIELSGNIAYIADGFNGFLTVDVSDPTVPIPLGSLNTADTGIDGANMRDVELVGSIAYIAAWEHGLFIVDVSNPAAPILLGSLDTAGLAGNAHISGTVAYIADWGSGLIMVDVSDPTTPTLIGSFDTAGEARDVEIMGNVAYVADWGEGLQLFDVSDPAVPVLLGSLDTTSARDVELLGEIAYVADMSDGVLSVDVSNPTTPVLLGTVETAGTAKDMELVGNVAYISDGVNGLVTVDVSDPAVPALLPPIHIAGNAEDIEVWGNVAYIADRFNGLLTIDVSDTAASTLLGSLGTAVSARDVAVRGNIAYIVDVANGLSIVDVSDLTAPMLLSRIGTDGIFDAVELQGNIAYIASDMNGLLIVDVSDPAAPTSLGSLNLTPLDAVGDNIIRDIEVLGNIVYLAYGDNGLMTVDVSNSAEPALLGTLYVPEPTFDIVDVEVVGSIAYITDGFNGLFVVDVSDPAAPTVVDFLATAASPRDVAILGEMAYIAEWKRGVLMVDVSDPTTLNSLFNVDMVGFASDVKVVGGVIYVAAGSGGVYMFEYMPPPDGDPFEINDECTSALPIEVDGAIQTHTFHDAGDQDWTKFDVEEGKTYRVIADALDESPADIFLALYVACDDVRVDTENPTLSTGIMVEFQAIAEMDTIYLQLLNSVATIAGDHVTYQLSVQEVNDDRTGAVIIVGGRAEANDHLQTNIDWTTDWVYGIFESNGHHPDDIYYLSTDNDHPAWSDWPTVANLENAIKVWAKERVDPDLALTIYMISHGNDIEHYFYLDSVYPEGEESQILHAYQLNQWLTELENEIADEHGGRYPKINLIIEMCHGGSFIEANINPDQADRERVIIASSNTNEYAYASQKSAYFTRFFFTELETGRSVYLAFIEAKERVLGLIPKLRNYGIYGDQVPQLEDNGNNSGNELTDGVRAAQRGFAWDGTFSDENDEERLLSTPQFVPPLITDVPLISVFDGRGTLTAYVKSDSDKPITVTAQIFAPSSEPVENSDRLVLPDADTVTLVKHASNPEQYVAPYDFTEVGEYYILIFAEDSDHLLAEPMPTSVLVDCFSDPCPPVNLFLHTNRAKLPFTIWWFPVSILLLLSLSLLLFRRRS